MEKSWHDPPTYRAAVRYVAVVAILAAIAATCYLVIDRTSLAWASSVPGVCLLGAIGALFQGYLTYRRGGTWVIWQGAAWVLLTLMLVTFLFPTMVYPSAG